MIFSCVSWISVICKELVSPFISSPQPPHEPLPNDVIANILSRLPAECLQQCRRVCKEWKLLISTSYFIEIHQKRATPTIFVQKWSKRDKHDLYSIDELGGINMRRKPRIKRITSDSTLVYIKRFTALRFSFNGLLVFEPLNGPPMRMGMIFNPFTGDKIKLDNFFGEIRGMFFHPIAREYRVLWLVSGEKNVEFRVINLQSRIYCRRLSSDLTSMPSNDLPPVNLHGALHWMSLLCYGDDGKRHAPSCSKSITIFNIVKEEFHVMPHPGDVPGDESKCIHMSMKLFDLEGNLSLCHLLKISGTLEIWILEDYANWQWARRHSVNLELDVLSKQVPNIKRLRMRPLGIQNGALILEFCSHGVFSYHLRQKTIKKFIFEKEEGVLYHVCLHTSSLVSLRNFLYF